VKHQRIGFFCESCLPFNGKSLEERPLGGTETGIIYLANELALKGYEVEVFTKYYDSDTEVTAANLPTYRPLQSIHSCKPFDALVLVKDYRPARFRLPSKKVFLLTGDGPEQYVNFGIGDHRMIVALDGIFCVSQWQAEVLSKESGYPRNKIFFIGNGVNLKNFSGTEERFPNRLFYASSPNRGLHLAFIAFQLLQKLEPKAEFHVFGGFDVYDDKQKFSGPLVAQFEALKNKMSQNKSVVLHGNCIQSQLAREMMKSSILFYPNQFVETSCIVALEAQAAGCAVIASNSGGLPETIGERGILISEPVGSKEYLIKFAETAHTLLSNQEMFKTLSGRGRSYIFQHGGWDKVTGRFIDIIQNYSS
jgi:glycosyltransferase involved in cell wall biosynthesis